VLQKKTNYFFARLFVGYMPAIAKLKKIDRSNVNKMGVADI
jgi:hypothetical protein